MSLKLTGRSGLFGLVCVVAVQFAPCGATAEVLSTISVGSFSYQSTDLTTGTAQSGALNASSTSLYAYVSKDMSELDDSSASGSAANGAVVSNSAALTGVMAAGSTNWASSGGEAVATASGNAANVSVNGGVSTYWSDVAVFGPTSDVFSIAAQTSLTVYVPYSITLSVSQGGDLSSASYEYTYADATLYIQSVGLSTTSSLFDQDWVSYAIYTSGSSDQSGVLSVTITNSTFASIAASLVLDISVGGQTTVVPEPSVLALVMASLAFLWVFCCRPVHAVKIFALAALFGVPAAFAQQKISCASVAPTTCQLAKELGRGVNFGNMLDAPEEGAWGVSVKSAYIDVASGAFNTVRLPVRWSNHAAQTIDGKLDETFAKRVDQIIDDLLSRDVYVILDFHHHNQLVGANLNAGEFSVSNSILDARFINIWRQVSTRYMGRSSKLVFEILNEPTGRLTVDRWNALSARVLAVIRLANPTRAVIVDAPHPATDASYAQFVVPADQFVIIGAHSYEPTTFTIQFGTPLIPCCDASQKTQIDASLDRMSALSQRTGYPVHLGEFGSYERAEIQARAAYTRYVRDAAESRGMSWAYWEFASYFGVYPAALNDWLLPIKSALLD